jgi:hypothetical protein
MADGGLGLSVGRPIRTNAPEELMANPREFFRSSNGDVWLLSSEAGHLFVLHQANLPAGGSIERIELSDFLKPSNGGPEHQELVRLIGSVLS